MRAAYVRLMDALYALCMTLAAAAIVAMVLIIAWSVFTRYVLGQGAFFAEPVSILLAVYMTFFGAAGCYRAGAHISIDALTRRFPAPLRRGVELAVDLLMAAIALFMVVYGISLSATTWVQVYPELQLIRVGAVYAAIPIAGVITLLFVIEQALLGPPPPRTLAETE